MGNPQVFISCVSSEFGTVRRRVADVLTRLGYTPVTQEVLGTEAGDLRRVLRDKIDPCAGLIQIVGHAYGAEPSTPDPSLGRVSYTQYELHYARAAGKKTWLVLAGDACNRDVPPDRLDLPPDPAHPDPLGYQRERRALQAAYVAAHQAGGDLFHLAASEAELVLKVEQLKDALADLRRGEIRWRRRVLGGLSTIVVLLVLVGGGLMWLRRGQAGIGDAQRQIAARIETLATDRAVSRERIRAHLLASVDRAHEVALAEAQGADGWEARQRLRDAADAEHAARLLRIDALAASFADIEGSARSTAVFDELTRVLAEEGVGPALSFAESQRAGILNRVRARAAVARQQDRDELLPLLRSAELRVTEGDHAGAATLFEDVLTLQPDWPAALDGRFWFLVARADRAASHGTATESRQHAEAAVAVAERLVALEPGNAAWQRDLSVGRLRVGAALVAAGDSAAALRAYRDGLTIAGRLAAADPRDVESQRDLSVGHERVGNVLAAQGEAGAALEAYRAAFAIRQRLAVSDAANLQWQRDLSVSHNKLGGMLAAQGDPAAALREYRSGLAIAERLAAANPGDAEAQRDLAVSHNRVGGVLASLGDQAAALRAYRDSLEIAERLAASDPANAQWQRDRSIGHERVGHALAAQGDTAAAKEALAAYRSALAIHERVAATDPGNAEWQRDLAVLHSTVGSALAAMGDSAAALTEYRADLTISARLAALDPGNAQWQRDLAVSHNQVGDVLAGRGELPTALAAYRDGLAVAERLAASRPGDAAWQRDVATGQERVGNVLVAQGDVPAGLAELRRALGVRERVAASDADNAQFQRELWVSHYNVAVVLEQQGDAAAGEHWRKARDALRGMRDGGLFVSPADQGVLEELERETAAR